MAGGTAPRPLTVVAVTDQKVADVFFTKYSMPNRDRTLPDRPNAIPVADKHAVHEAPLAPPYPEGLESAIFGMGCFWGAERIFWQTPGVYTTAVGYAGGITKNPTYDDVCSGRTGHTEAVLVVFDPDVVSYADLLKVFWESHDPTQGMRQGNDVGTQYRSAAYYFDDAQREVLERSREAYGAALAAAGYGEITTEIAPASNFFFAENYHQQYLHKVPNGYCGIGGTGVACPAGVGVDSAPAGTGVEAPQPVER